MTSKSIYPLVQVILAAILFGASAPLSKILLGQVAPVMLAALLYLGSGIGLILFKIFQRAVKRKENEEAPLGKKDLLWLLGAVFFGGAAAPILNMSGLQITPASTASLLLNFEGVATTVIAAVFFKEAIGKRAWSAVLLVTFAGIILSWDFTNQWGLSKGAFFIILACICWGMDNNFTRNISLKDPFSIVIIKGLGAGSFSLLLSLLLKVEVPGAYIIISGMLLGFFSYGLSILLFVIAMRGLGSARTSTLFGMAPFIGALISFLICGDKPQITFIISLPLMLLGAVLLLRENHCHKHLHRAVTHEHRHCHTDGHHNHVHAPGEVPEDGYHSHMHSHEEMWHEHEHVPDIHHRHKHDSII